MSDADGTQWQTPLAPGRLLRLSDVLSLPGDAVSHIPSARDRFTSIIDGWERFPEPWLKSAFASQFEEWGNPANKASHSFTYRFVQLSDSKASFSDAAAARPPTTLRTQP